MILAILIFVALIFIGAAFINERVNKINSITINTDMEIALLRMDVREVMRVLCDLNNTINSIDIELDHSLFSKFWRMRLEGAIDKTLEEGGLFDQHNQSADTKD